MTKDEAIERLARLPGDAEMAHGLAEDILCEFLREIGHPEVADAFDRARNTIGFWYA